MVLGWGYRRGVTVQLRFLVWPALLFYALEAYSAIRFAAAHDAGSPAEGMALAIVRGIQAGLVAALTVAESFRCCQAASYMIDDCCAVQQSPS